MLGAPWPRDFSKTDRSVVRSGSQSLGIGAAHDPKLNMFKSVG